MNLDASQADPFETIANSGSAPEGDDPFEKIANLGGVPEPETSSTAAFGRSAVRSA